MQVKDVLAETAAWPVDTVAAAALHGTTVTAHGDTGRLFPLASVSKLVTAHSVLIATEEGAFSLGDTVAEINEEYATNVEGPPDATVRELLSHASGVGMQSRVREKPAGTRRIYSSAGYEILADLVSATGIPFAGYTRAAVCEPLGLSTDDIDLSGSAGHGFSATLSAMTALAAEFLTPTLLSEQTWVDALSIQNGDLDGIVPGYGRQNPCPWGLGAEIHDGKSPHWMGQTMPPDTAGHFGQSGTFLWFHRPTGNAAVVLTDRDFGPWAKERWDGFNDRLWDALQPRS
ncbi:serine hydrolase [Corynebacterium sp.]|mgnify:CR=1 FL=1|uniref:serine hydrolase domain-containing protein n=1 Tax=Corynebacterium sp. TaxID=1720 RepID=UPI0025C573F2|nr:serine hydrolase [Corynebacterium sp.]